MNEFQVGDTVYSTNGNFCATSLAPLGSIIEVRSIKTGKAPVEWRLAK